MLDLAYSPCKSTNCFDRRWWVSNHDDMTEFGSGLILNFRK